MGNNSVSRNIRQPTTVILVRREMTLLPADPSVVRAASNAADDADPFGTVLDSDSQEATLVVMASGGRWPDWVSDELVGRRSSIVIAQQPNERGDELAERVLKLVANTTATVSQVIWLREATTLNSSVVFDLVAALRPRLALDYGLRIVGTPTRASSLASETANPSDSVSQLRPKSAATSTKPDVPVGQSAQGPKRRVPCASAVVTSPNASQEPTIVPAPAIPKIA